MALPTTAREGFLFNQGKEHIPPTKAGLTLAIQFSG